LEEVLFSAELHAFMTLPITKSTKIWGPVTPEMTMEHSGERPSKIRKLDSDFDDDQFSEVESSADVQFLSWSKDDAETSTTNNPAEVVPPAIEEDQTIPLSTNGNDVAHEANPAKPMSKNQLKKLRKRQQWEEGREYRKAKNKQKKKGKKIRKAEERAAEERATVDQQSTEDVLRPATGPKRSHFQPIQLPITFVLDCDFDALMTEAEIISLGSQLTRSYSDNRHAPYQAHLVISSFGGKLKQRFETVLANSHLGWKGVKFTAEDFVAAAWGADYVMRAPRGGQLVGPFAEAKCPLPLTRRSLPPSTGTPDSSNVTSPRDPPSSDTAATKGTIPNENRPTAAATATASTEQNYSLNSASITKESGITCGTAADKPAAIADDQGSQSSHEPSMVYLTSDSPHTLDVLSPYTTYIIGGLVDKNRHKGICYKRAMGRNIPTAKLPIGEYMTLQSRSVLATNHVVEIMVRWLENGDWAKAFLQVIPKRKEARLKAKMETGGDLQNKDDDTASSGSQEDKTFKGGSDQG
jgi:tRNA (guanine9-N1)-methyltransferase